MTGGSAFFIAQHLLSFGTTLERLSNALDFARGRQNKFRHGTTRVGALVVGKWPAEPWDTLELETEEWVSG
ncbi:MAG: hypothetical protein DMG43_12570 [Acidobacteria bacterium]|nr:MAG: hypothetical protein DMG43_12570 [Acidobacteriota bacterium]